MAHFKPVDSATIQSNLTSLEPAIKDRIREVSLSSRSVSNLGYLVFEVFPELSFERLPISTATFDENRHELASNLHCEEFLDNHPFLEPKHGYPLGRHDWLGVNTIPDYELVLNETIRFFRRVWLEIDSTDRLPMAYIGLQLYDELEQKATCEVVNLHTGDTEHIVFTFDE